MGVYIPGMEMPESCRACHLKMNCDDCEGRKCVCVPLHQNIGYLDELLTDKRRDDCPLVSVQNHGRLIDVDYADEYAYDELELANTYLTGWEAARAMQKIYHNAPTIIPADKEGEGCIS